MYLFKKKKKRIIELLLVSDTGNKFMEKTDLFMLLWSLLEWKKWQKKYKHVEAKQYAAKHKLINL